MNWFGYSCAEAMLTDSFSRPRFSDTRCKYTVALAQISKVTLSNPRLRLAQERQIRTTRRQRWRPRQYHGHLRCAQLRHWSLDSGMGALPR
jgi:hypothetical protein